MELKELFEEIRHIIISEEHPDSTEVLVKIRDLIDDFDIKLKNMEYEYRKLLLKDIKLGIKNRRASLMLSRIELWRILKLKKEMDEYDREFGEEDKEERNRLIS